MGIDLGPYFDQLVRLLRALIQRGSGREHGTAGDGTAVMLRRLDAGDGKWNVLATMGAGSEATFGEVIDPAPIRPAHYPAGLPFIPGLHVLVSGVDPLVLLLWPTAGPDAALAHRAVAASQADGWTLVGASAPDSGDPVRYCAMLRQPESRRSVWSLDLGGAQAVLLLQHPGYDDPSVPAAEPG